MIETKDLDRTAVAKVAKDFGVARSYIENAICAYLNARTTPALPPLPIKVTSALEVTCSGGLVIILQKPYRDRENIAWQSAPDIARQVGEALTAAAS